ncbi:hypothetical protein Taro_030354 [Colocasia esculenta]|uniref:Uncharacterized protein n=1 Tax=Colocasia esculenta TaxID=4460 RepID=A0A843VG53_COLES|nr:hypothetical protein [Colocasia esculenta]
MYKHNITGETLIGKSYKPQLSHNCANTRAHLELVKPRPRVTNSRATASVKARVKPQLKQAKHVRKNDVTTTTTGANRARVA